jgi:methane/ammonia monooxygenase subunit B
MIMKNLTTMLRLLMLLSIAILGDLMAIPAAQAHGEKAQEPYLRTRTVMFYDIEFDRTKVKVGEQFTVTGKLRMMQDWPDAVTAPDMTNVSIISPGPVVTRVESWVNGMPARQSFAKMQLGREYEFRIVMEGRQPGVHHIHPSLSVKGSGALVGAGQWITVEDTGLVHKASYTTINKVKIDDLAWHGFGHVMTLHGLWFGLAVAWLLFWLVRPLLLPRWIVLNKGREDLLVSRTDMSVGFGLGIVCVVLTFGIYFHYADKYTFNVPLQAGSQKVDPLPLTPVDIKAKVLSAQYDVPGRSMRMKVRLTNTGTKELAIGEFTTANIRFLNRAVPAAVKAVPANYPPELIAPTGLKISDASPLKPGETREVFLDATDTVWESERIVSFLTDVDSKFGALLFLYDPEGKRQIVELDGSILPVFTDL